MRSLMIIAAVLSLSACAVHRDTPERRYAVCMKTILGNFEDFKPTDARLKAAEVCRPILVPPQQSQASAASP